jgi:tetratricopeptide (TPR) repeat protein
MSRVKLEDYIGSIEDYNKAINFDPEFAIAYCNRGNSKLKLKDCLQDKIQFLI